METISPRLEFNYTIALFCQDGFFGTTFLNGKIHLWCGKDKEKPQSQIMTDNHYFFTYEPRLTLSNCRHLTKVLASLYRKWISFCRETLGFLIWAPWVKPSKWKELKAGSCHKEAMSSRSDLQSFWDLFYFCLPELSRLILWANQP